jgi:hypothetical protein
MQTLRAERNAVATDAELHIILGGEVIMTDFFRCQARGTPRPTPAYTGDPERQRVSCLSDPISEPTLPPPRTTHER